MATYHSSQGFKEFLDHSNVHPHNGPSANLQQPRSVETYSHVNNDIVNAPTPVPSQNRRHPRATYYHSFPYSEDASIANGPRTAPLLPSGTVYSPLTATHPISSSQPNSPQLFHREVHPFASAQSQILNPHHPTLTNGPGSNRVNGPISPRPRYAYVPPSGPSSPSRLNSSGTRLTLPNGQTYETAPIDFDLNAEHSATLVPVPSKSSNGNVNDHDHDLNLKPRSPAHAATQAGTGTPFIAKLLHLLNNEKYLPYIRWNSKGDAFILSHTNQYFAQNILPLLFRHSNTSSFIRQLNMYGFSRLPIMQLLEAIDDSTTPGSLGTGVNASTSCYSGFAHPLFKRGQEELSWMIKPKAATSRTSLDNGLIYGEVGSKPSRHHKHSKRSNRSKTSSTVATSRKPVSSLQNVSRPGSSSSKSHSTSTRSATQPSHYGDHGAHPYPTPLDPYQYGYPPNQHSSHMLPPSQHGSHHLINPTHHFTTNVHGHATITELTQTHHLGGLPERSHPAVTVPESTVLDHTNRHVRPHDVENFPEMHFSEGRTGNFVEGRTGNFTEEQDGNFSEERFGNFSEEHVGNFSEEPVGNFSQEHLRVPVEESFESSMVAQNFTPLQDGSLHDASLRNTGFGDNALHDDALRDTDLHDNALHDNALHEENGIDVNQDGEAEMESDNEMDAEGEGEIFEDSVETGLESQLHGQLE